MKTPCAALLLACCVFIGGCVTHSEQAEAVLSDPSEVLKPGDTITVYFDDSTSGHAFAGLDASRLQIDDRGTVTLNPYIGAIEIAGLTTTQAAARIRDAYVPKYLPELPVIVEKAESITRKAVSDDDSSVTNPPR